MQEDDSFRLFSEEFAGALALVALAVCMILDHLGAFAP